MRKVEDQISSLEFYAQEAISFLENKTYKEFAEDHKTIAAISMMIIAMAEIIQELPDWF